MKTIWFALAVLGTGLIHAGPAWSQDRDVVVVTGSMIQSDDEYEEEFGALPYISIVAPADFVIFTVNLESATSAFPDRLRELERSFANLAQQAARAQGVTMEVGRPGSSAPLETAAASEAIENAGARSRIPVVLKFAIRPGDTFLAVRTRAEAFVDAIQISGRAEATTGSDQYIGVNEPAKHREDLMRKIAADIRLLQEIFTPGPGQPAPAMTMTGLASRVKTRPVGPLELEMFVPYNIVLGAPLPQPPPRN
jgi:hypothetical protein